MMADVTRYNVVTAPTMVRRYQWELAAVLAGIDGELHGSEHYQQQARERSLPETVHSVTEGQLVEVQLLRGHLWRFVVRLVGYDKPGTSGDTLDLEEVTSNE